MPARPDVASFLQRLGVALAESRVRFTWKAEDELDRYLWIRVAEGVRGTLIVSFHLAEKDPWT